VWEDLSMDFIAHLPSSMGHIVMWVICDRLTKYGHFIALPIHFIAQSLACRSSIKICCLHDLPKTIVFDWDPLFLRTFWRTLFKAQGITLQFSSSYHSKTDEHREVLNRGLKAYLRCFTGAQLVPILALGRTLYNTSYHLSTGTSPFLALYRRPPPTTLNMLHTFKDNTTNIRPSPTHIGLAQSKKSSSLHSSTNG